MTAHRRRPGPVIVSAVQDHADAERWRAAEPLLWALREKYLGSGWYSPDADAAVEAVLALLPDDPQNATEDPHA